MSSGRLYPFYRLHQPSHLSCRAQQDCVLDLEAGGIAWGIKLLRGYLWSTKFVLWSAQEAVESIGKGGWTQCPSFSAGWNTLSNFTYTLEDREGSANGNAAFLSCLPLPATDADEPGLNPSAMSTHLESSSSTPTIGSVTPILPRLFAWVGSLAQGRLRSPVSP